MAKIEEVKFPLILNAEELFRIPLTVAPDVTRHFVAESDDSLITIDIEPELIEATESVRRYKGVHLSNEAYKILEGNGFNFNGMIEGQHIVSKKSPKE